MPLVTGLNSSSTFDGIDVANNIPATGGATRLGKLVQPPRLAMP